MAKIFTKKRVKKIVSIVLALATAVGAIFGIKAVVDEINNPQKTILPKFEVGGLTSSGLYEDTDDTIYTKKAFSAKGLEVKLDFDASVEYQVFFYDDLDKFISCTEVYSESQDISVPAGAFARIEVTPIWGADAPLEKEIKWYNVSKYSKQLEINVDKRQELLESDFTAIKLTDTTKFFKYDERMYIYSDGDIEVSPFVGCNTYVMTLKDNYNKMYVKFSDDVSIDEWSYLMIIDGETGGLNYMLDMTDLMSLSVDNLLDVAPGDLFYFVVYEAELSAEDVAMMFYFA